MFRDVLQGITPIDKHLIKLEIGVIESFELTEIIKSNEYISIDIIKEDFQ